MEWAGSEDEDPLSNALIPTMTRFTPRSPREDFEGRDPAPPGEPEILDS
jgi:hypothetical protein